MSIIKSLIIKYKFLKNPIDYCRSLGVQIGDNCSILGSNSPFGSEPYLIKLGNCVRINDGVQFVTHDGGVWVLRNIKHFRPEVDVSMIDLFGRIIVGDNVQIGSNAMIMPGVTIGSNVIIGAGAIVTRDVPDNSVVAGVPARRIESIDDYYSKHANDFDFTKDYSYEQKKEYLIKKFHIDNR